MEYNPVSLFVDDFDRDEQSRFFGKFNPIDLGRNVSLNFSGIVHPIPILHPIELGNESYSLLYFFSARDNSSDGDIPLDLSNGQKKLAKSGIDKFMQENFSTHDYKICSLNDFL